ncbi:MAG: efflux transporter outer membrane subunit [Pseudomonadota bacterium]|nr:efflux transporter outer membrane subunit [Pseudomonadota bacterium]
MGWRGAAVRGLMLGLTLELSGCAAVGPNYERPAAIVPARYKEFKGWKPASPRDDVAKGAWWSVLRDPELNRLEPMVAVSNQTVLADAANYRQALALLAQARAGLAPMLNFNPSLVRSSPGVDALNAQASASWTLDVWGRLARTVEEQGAAAQASAALGANATLAAQAALALAYVQLRQADSLRALLAATAASYQRSLDVAQNQYDAGTAAKSDVITAQALLLQTRAQLVNTDVARAQSEHAIAVLVGRPPAEVAIARGGLADNPPAVPVGVASELLERRPDIAAAERVMQQQNAAIGVAIAGYFPDITISGAFGYAGNPFVRQIAGANPVWTYGLALAQPLLNGGLTDAQVAAARAGYESSVATYRQTVLTAFQQVEDNLAAIRVLSDEIVIQIKATKAAEQAVRIALNEYRAGTQSYTTVVTAQAIALADEQTLLSTRAQRLSAVVNLIVALGGGWSRDKLPAIEPPAATRPAGDVPKAEGVAPGAAAAT